MRLLFYMTRVINVTIYLFFNLFNLSRYRPLPIHFINDPHTNASLIHLKYEINVIKKTFLQIILTSKIRLNINKAISSIAVQQTMSVRHASIFIRHCLLIVPLSSHKSGILYRFS